MKRRIPTFMAIVITLLFAVLAVNRLDWTGSDFLTSLDMRWLDTKFRWRGEQAPGDEVIIVAIDDRTLAEMGGSARTMARSVPARMIDAIAAAGASVIGFDVLYSEADISNVENDRLFAEAIERAGNVVMGVYLDLESTTGERGERDELSPELQELVIEKQVYPAV